MPENCQGFRLNGCLQHSFQLGANGIPDSFVGPIEDLRSRYTTQEGRKQQSVLRRPAAEEQGIKDGPKHHQALGLGDEEAKAAQGRRQTTDWHRGCGYDNGRVVNGSEHRRQLRVHL